ncbi:hypothetical protein CTAYLR_000475 [Chrysophaeum taylorii]|uniref:RRM domain-containing protein n=1 Tax=Chrysophaeum taylorii TaxID=2483200 RepID=A0AAD7XJU5_9STRA|nr:hypothetical protein CTAYLR_000475 [Chrysophaeum taylorii]
MEEHVLLVKARAIEARLKVLKRKLAEEAVPSATSAKGSRVIYIGHIPHGFYEDEIQGFFSQFGKVTNSRLSRSKKTGGSKGYAFVEFADPDVARIAAAAMDKYLMGSKQLVCRVLESAFVEARPTLFRGKKRRVDRTPRTKLGDRVANPANLEKSAKRKRKSLEALGIHYDFPLKKMPDTPKLTTKNKKKKKEENTTKMQA